MKLGVCYYPEHWPESEWAHDAQRMRDLGISVVRIGEFAWKELEPTDGHLEFDWLRRAIDTLHEHGLEVVLGTPTATPPKWLVNKHPSILARDHFGHERRFGSRRHYCFSSAVYREECHRIVTLLAQEFGQHPGVTAWQTDNEYGCHSTAISYSDDARCAFQLWCEKNYGSIDELNRLWGNYFWSMSYCEFTEIDLPLLTATEANPAHQLAFWRFSSQQITTFNALQADIIRAHSPGRDVTHNFMGNFAEFDHREVAETLDVVTWDNYPLGFLDRDTSNPIDLKKWYRTGHPDSSAFHHDLYRGMCGGRWWIMEQQPGPVNWAPHNPSPLPGMVKIWGWEGFTHGAEVVSYFRWRQLPAAQEQMHTGLCLPNGDFDVAASEVRAIKEDLQSLEQHHAEALKAHYRAQVAIIYDYASDCAMRIQQPGGQSGLHAPVGGAFDPMVWTQQVHSACRAFGLNVDIVAPDADLSGYRLVIAACNSIATPELVTTLSTCEGRVLIMPRSGSKTADHSIPEQLAPGLLQSLIPVQVIRAESLPQEIQMMATAHYGEETSESHGEETSQNSDQNSDLNSGQSSDLNSSRNTGTEQVIAMLWREHIRSDITPQGSFEDGWGFHYRSGKFDYLNAWLEPTSLQRFMQQQLESAGIGTTPCPDGVRLRRLGNIQFVFNYGPDACDLHASFLQSVDCKFVLGKQHLKPGDMAAWLVTGV